MTVEENIKKISKNGQFMLLAYDQGMEIGPTEFNDDNVDPEYIFRIADNGFYTGVIVGGGLAEKYYASQNRKAPLIVKLNGKENLREGEPVSLQITSVEEAIKLGAVGVGYTVYVGSEREPEMFQEFGKIQEAAHDKGLVVVGWMYPRGRSVPDPLDPDVTAYAARIGLELGADLVKVHWPGSVESMRWVVRSAGKAGVLSSGGKHTTEGETYQLARDVMSSGAAGMAIGRNVWEAKDPESVSKKLHEIIFEEK
jgi:class I fructose-bisphosphate aldolase